MNNIIRFLSFILYSACIFFIPNSKFILCLFGINFLIILLFKLDIKKIVRSTLKLFPFIIFTFLINCIMDNYINAMYIAIKLIIVCNITVAYSNTTSVSEISKTIETLCIPLKKFKIDIKEIGLLVSISLSMLPILKKEMYEVKDACKAKNISFNIRNSKYILSKYFISLIRRVNQIEESIISKGYNKI